MGKDYRGNFRKECLIKDCDCEEYEAPSNIDDDVERSNCNYCGCPPAKHRRCNPPADPARSSSSSNSALTVSSLENDTAALSSQLGLNFAPPKEPKWKHTKYGYVPNATKKICLFGNELLPTFFDSFKVRSGGNVPEMKRMFIAERDRQYFVNQELEKRQNEFKYLISDNPACAGSFLAGNYMPKPHDKANILRCKSLASKLKCKSENLKAKITQHDDSLFSKKSGKLQTGLDCHHNFNSNVIHSINTGLQRNIADLIENLDKAMSKCKATYSTRTTSKSSSSRKVKESRNKCAKRKLASADQRKKRACIIFQSLGGSPADGEYNPEIYGIPQVDDIEYEQLSMFTSQTDKSCLRDLLSCKCFVGEAEELVHNYCF